MAAERPNATLDAEAAKNLLVGRGAPFSPEEGIAAIEKLSEDGDADAMCTLATLRGAGAWTHQSWPEALDLLQQAAELGSALARSQLLVLSPDAGLAAAIRRGDNREANRWRGLREPLDLQAWVIPTAPVKVLESPQAWVVEKFATPELCEWLISRVRGFNPALLLDRSTGVTSALDSRNCTDFVFDVLDGAIVMLLLRIKISNATTIPVPHMEPPQIFHYALGQEIHPHHDFLSDGEKGYGADGTYMGDRLATFLMYLNDGFEGGELEFPHAKHTHKGKVGDAIFFASQRNKVRDPMSLHGARPVTRGEKFILSQWIHDRPFAAS